MISIIGHSKVEQMRAFEPVQDCLDGRMVFDVYLGAFIAKHLGVNLKDKVIYNMEYLHDNSPPFDHGYLDTLSESTVLDFSRSNVDWLASKGIDAFYMPYGFSSKNIKPQVAAKKDIDVLFIGSMHFDRRANVISKLQDLGLNVVIAKNVYGGELDKLISRAKIHLNMHHAEGQPLETVRVNQLISMGCTVVSERGSDEALNDLYDGLLVFSSYEKLHQKCLELVCCEYTVGSIPDELIQDCEQANNWGVEKCQA